MQKKYEFTGETMLFKGHTLHRIRALRDFGNIRFVAAGEIGGWIESEKNLSHEDSAWVADEAKVFHRANVCGDAQVYENAQVYGYAVVSCDARVYGNALVYNKATIYGNARVCDNAKVYGRTYLADHTKISGRVQVSGMGHIWTTDPVKQ